MSKKKKAQEEPKAKPVKVKKEGNIVLTFLTVLLFLSGVGEAGLLGYIGLATVQGRAEQQSHESRLPAVTDDMPSNPKPLTYKYLGSWRHEEDGVVLWAWDDNLTGSTQTLVDKTDQSSSKLQNNNVPNSGSQSRVEGAENQRPSTLDFSGGRVLITKASDNNNDPVYHTKYCTSAKKISQIDMYWFNSAEEAKADGRRLCGICAR